jgi:glutamate/tyrosine decarboxylase-like PLP-dependent enzyme
VQKSDSVFRVPLNAALHHALLHLENQDELPASATVDLHGLRKQLRKELTAGGMTPEQVVAELVDDVEGGILGSAGGRFFGWVVGGSLPAALAADWLTAAWDQNAAMYTCAPAAAIAEEVAGAWLKEILGLPAQASFALVSGCQMAHSTCLAAARHALLAKRGWDVERQGLYGAPPIRILTSDQRHGTFERAVRLLGLGSQHIDDLPVDSQGRLRSDALRQALESHASEPTIVLLQAGDVNTGAYDALDQLIPIAHEHNAWVHVDGAFGLWAAASPKYQHLVHGVSAADSWATDGHKWLNVPYDCGYAFVLDSESHRASLAHRAPYLTHDSGARDEMDWNPEWSRRARGFPTYAALRQLGRDGVAELVDRCCRHAHSLTTRIGHLPGAELVWEPVINQGLVRFLDSRSSACEEDHDRRTDQVIAAILASGEAFFGGTTWRGRRAMRVSVCSWRTTDEDVDRVVNAVAQLLGGQDQAAAARD